MSLPQESLTSRVRTGFPFLWGFPSGLDGKESACNAGSLGSIPESERSPGEGNGCSLQYVCLGNPTERGFVHGVASVGHDLSDLTVAYPLGTQFN